MIISILNADINFGIGKKNGLLFDLPKDMNFFRETTKGHVVCMGQNTLRSFPGSKPLPKRVNVVLSGDLNNNYDGCVNVHTFEEFLKTIKEYSLKEDVYIIGGASIYQQTLPYVDKVLLTRVYADGKAEVFFPNLDEDNYFELVKESDWEDDNGYQIKFCTYKNKHPQKIKI